jgi:hypothetical protein
MKSPASKSVPQKRPNPVKKTPAPKPAVTRKPAAPAASKTAAAKKSSALPVAIAKPAKIKLKLVRDSFTLPEADHELIKKCKKAAITSGRETKKSEVVRAAIQSFSQLSLGEQLAIYNGLQPIAVGRPKSA